MARLFSPIPLYFKTLLGDHKEGKQSARVPETCFSDIPKHIFVYKPIFVQITFSFILATSCPETLPDEKAVFF